MANDSAAADNKPTGIVGTFLDLIEKLGNKLPDPAMLFLIGMIIIWVLSAIMSTMTFSALDPRTEEAIEVVNLLAPSQFVTFLAGMVNTFTSFAPLGVVLVAMLGVGVAEHSGYINTGLKLVLSVIPKVLLTPMVIMVGLVSHTAVDAGYVLVIPLGGVIYHAAGRHPLAGIAAAFAGVSGGFSANFFPSAIDPLLQGFTQTAAQIVDPDINVNVLCNYFFTFSSSFLIMGVGWLLTDMFIEPRLNRNVALDEDIEEPEMEGFTSREVKSFWAATTLMIAGFAFIILSILPSDSPWRTPQGAWDDFSAPIMQSIVPLIFLLFILPGVLYGFMAGTFKTAKDVVDQMSKAMNSMSYYIVMAFFCALFIYAFGNSNIGTLIAVKGAQGLKAMNLPPGVTIAGIIFLTAFVNLLVGSASAKWALIGPIFVPILMQVGISPDLAQAAYRVGDSSSNIITPLMPYFPLVVVFCQRYVKKTGIGTLVSMMLPYCIVFLIIWTLYLLLYWQLGIPLGFGSSYTYPAS